MDEGHKIKLERQIAEDTEATQIRLRAQYCGFCGTHLDESGKCTHRCGEPEKLEELSKFYATRFEPRKCPLCRDGMTRPAADKMVGRRWWNDRTASQVRRCGSCFFTGTPWEFDVEKARLALIALSNQMYEIGTSFPDYDGNPTW